MERDGLDIKMIKAMNEEMKGFRVSGATIHFTLNQDSSNCRGQIILLYLAHIVNVAIETMSAISEMK